MKCVPTIAVLSSDPVVAKLAHEIGRGRWRVEQHTSALTDKKIFAYPGIRIVIFDDEAYLHADRGWMLGQIRSRAPGASILYVAAKHDQGTERQARINGAQYYCAKPIDQKDFRTVLDSFLRASK
jgi:response regulator of citrate/malate metabolism